MMRIVIASLAIVTAALAVPAPASASTTVLTPYDVPVGTTLTFVVPGLGPSLEQLVPSARIASSTQLGDLDASLVAIHCDESVLMNCIGFIVTNA